MAHPHNTHKPRTRRAILGTLALVAALLATAAGPASAAEITNGEANKAEPSATPTFSACVGDATDDHGFEDLGSLDAAANDINCLAYYGITKGTSATTFDPDSNVTRGQMALFLYRAATVAGVDLMGGDMDAMYTDIDELSEERQAAIKALARNGILNGRSSTTFAPLEDITRAEMAVALVNLTMHTAPGRFVQAGTDKGKLAVNGAAISSGDLDWFTDARLTMPRSVDTAISYAYELAITTGYPNGSSTSTEFRPNDPVPRRNMATFITRALAHTNLRPEGLTIQSDNGQLTASIRDNDFKPVANELVDAFYVSSDKEDRALNNDGECRSIVQAVDGTSDHTCEIHVKDAATDADGNAPLNGLDGTKIGKGVTVWAWTGEPGDEVDEDTDLVNLDQGPVVTPSDAAKITVSPSQTETPMARFGTAVQFTGQLQYTDGGLDKDTSVGAMADMGAAQYSLVIHVYTDTATTVTVDPGTGAVTTTPTLGLVSRSAPETLKSDADGKITFSVSTSDPNPSATSLDDSRTVVYVLTPMTNAPGAASDVGNPTTRPYGYVVFAEAGSQVTNVSVESIGTYAELPANDSNPASHGVAVTVTDQYGRPMRNQEVTLSSDQGVSSAMPGPRRTGPNGSVRIFYDHSGTTPVTETVTATWDAGPGPDGEAGNNDDPVDKTGEASVYWAQRAGDDDQTGAPGVLAASLADDEIVVAGPLLVRYDANDIFKVTAPDGGVSYLEIEDFEDQLAAIIDPANQALDAGVTGKRTGTLNWSGYDADDEDDRTFFELVVST